MDPWVKGTAALFTREFFEAARDHLNPGGIVTMFVQLYETSPEAVKSQVATFFDVFPNSVIFGNTRQGLGYDMVVVGAALVVTAPVVGAAEDGAGAVGDDAAGAGLLAAGTGAELR